MTRSRKLDRRTFLRGAGGVAIGLPLLESMGEQARAADPPGVPRRYLVCYGGTSLGSNDDPLVDDLSPDTVGPDYDVKSAIAPFGKDPGDGSEYYPGGNDYYDVASEITVVSGLRIPCAQGGSPPAGGKPDDFHGYMLAPLFSGVRSTLDSLKLSAPTSDQIVAAAVAADPTYDPRLRTLAYRIQASYYQAGYTFSWDGVMSYEDTGSGVEPFLPNGSPKGAFEALFYNFDKPDDPVAAAEQDRRWRMRKSVLDVVRGNTERLIERLGVADQRRLERHYDEIRDLEKRISALPPSPHGSCQPLPHPGEDPAVGTDFIYEDGMFTNYDVNVGYSGEEERARVFCDLVHMAFACDLSRVSTLMFTTQQSFLNMHPLIGIPTDLHAIGHSGYGTLGVSQAIAWDVKHFAYFIDKCRSTPEGDGCLLDSLAATFLFEGGHGHDFGSGQDNSPHSTENMVALVGGRAGGLNHGVHLVAEGLHPANVLVSAMNAVGVETGSLGEVEGGIPGLLT